ncbi:SAM-dependent methyltransferase [Planctomycetota bacterium]
MRKKQEKVSREIGLEISAICGEYFFKLRHLHYGYWPADLEIDIANLQAAQEHYTKLLISHIPDDVKTILDVGCGLGQTAKSLLESGYRVDCVSPSHFLTERIHALLGNTSHIFECPYEQLETEYRYDMVLFSESFQYVVLQGSLEKSLRLLNDDGYLLICDIFRKDVEGKMSMSGGHYLTKFYELIAKSSFRKIKDLDITEQTAPSIDLLNDIMKNVVQPVVNASVRFFESRYPLTLKLLRWKYKRKLLNIHRKYFEGGRTGENFKKFKSYRLLLYRKHSNK